MRSEFRPEVGGLIRCTKRNTCPVCGKPDWCSATPGGAVAVCMRVSEGARKPSANGGWVHVIRPDAERPACVVHKPEEPPRDWTRPVIERHRATPVPWLEQLADELGVTVEALVQLRVFRVLNGPFRGWAGFPMRWPNGQVVGVRGRWRRGCWLPPDGKKKRTLSGKGEGEKHRSGLFLPWVTMPVDGPVVICEGNTDCAALLSIGLYAIGRPSCRGNEEHVAELVRGRQSVTVLADRDGPGLDGARDLATLLSLHVEDVLVATPPTPHKDARDWIRAGATRDDVLEVVGHAEPLRWGGV